MKGDLDLAARRYAHLVAKRRTARFVLTLYVTGLSPRSTEAIVSIRAVCESELKGRYELEVVDVARDPAVALSEQVIAAPTLIRRLPLPLRRIVGSLADRERVLYGLGLRTVPGS